MAVEPAAPSAFPVPPAELSKIATEACDAALKTSEGYDHLAVSSWNSAIINSVLKGLIAATTPDQKSPPPYRFTVNSTIVQQGVIDKAAAGGSDDVGKRGMHSASGAFWDVNRDGMWTFKYPGAEERGLDVVVSVTWFAMS
ncbi:Tctex-1 [Talaromyces proteolyticus]|uniref:Tctex-1 n=1 Tax=Talaromyces proteolyticus TaxID=1131652 RepID=A0AAD4KKU0_9EURO|nr:Tctex-1 [Talaromyces proteolyticus]KAH8693283.1 Tctex-1 [Talaromyces proteolyticus]